MTDLPDHSTTQATGSPTAAPADAALPPPAPLPDSIKARLRAEAVVHASAGAQSIPVASPPAKGVAGRWRDAVAAARDKFAAQRASSAGTGNFPRQRLKLVARQRLAAMAAVLPARLSLDKLSVPRLSPELRDGLVKHGRRAGLNIGTALDKIVRNAPRPSTLLALPPPEVDTTSADAKTVRTAALQRAVKQPSIFAPGHVLTALLAGGIIHIATTFATTSIGTGSAFRQMRQVLPANQLVVLPAQSPTTQLLPFLAPDMLYAMCRFDLSSGAIEVNALLPEAGWSLALYTRQGDNFYATPGQSLRPVPVAFVLAQASDRLINITPGVRKTDVDISQVTSPDQEGLVVIRAPIKGVAFEGIAQAELKRATCKPSRR